MDGVEILNIVYLTQSSISPIILIAFLAAAALFFAIGIINFFRKHPIANLSFICSAITVTILLILECIGFGNPKETDLIDYYEIAVDEELVNQEEFDLTYKILEEIEEYAEIAPSRSYYKVRLK